MSDNSVEVTWERVAKIWWALAWRGVLIGGLVGLVVGVITANVAAGLGTDWSTIQGIVRLTGLWLML